MSAKNKQIIDKLEYCISLREKGFDSTEIKKKIKDKGFKEIEPRYLLKESDIIYLNRLQMKSNKREKRAKDM